MRKLNNQPRKNNILKLRKQGLSFKEIAKKLGCSLSTTSYHCGNGNEKIRVKSQKRLPICSKVSSFKARCLRSNFESFRAKLKTFKRRSKGRNPTTTVVNSIKKNYSCKDVISKIGETPKCYLTGEDIDINKPETYNLDHIIPVSKGGSNDLSNLGICLKKANQAKGELLIDELHDLCEKILQWRDECKNTP